MVPDRQKVRTDGRNGRTDGRNGRTNGQTTQNYIPPTSSGDNKHVSSNGSENFRYGKHTYFFKLFFSGKNMILCILKGISPFKMHKIIYFPENMKKILDFASKFR